MSLQDDQDALRGVFRAQELQRREARRRVIVNHAILSAAAPDEVEVEALRILRRQSDAYEKMVSGGYWRRLWRALLGRWK